MKLFKNCVLKKLSKILLLLFFSFFKTTFAQHQNVTIRITQYTGDNGPGRVEDGLPEPKLIKSWRLEAKELKIDNFNDSAIVMKDTISDKKFIFRVNLSEFHPQNHIYNEEKHTIDGLRYYGSETGLPYTEITEYFLLINEKKIKIPTTAYKQNYNIYTHSQSYPTIRAYYVPDSNLFFCSFSGGDAAGNYKAIQLFANNKYVTTYYGSSYEDGYTPLNNDFFAQNNDKYFYSIEFDKLDKSRDAEYIIKNAGDKEYIENISNTNLSAFLKTDSSLLSSLGEFGYMQNRPIYFFITDAYKDKSNPLLYHIEGKNYYKGLKTSFKGSIWVKRGIKYQQISGTNPYNRITVVGSYILKEELNSKGSGIFNGTIVYDLKIIGQEQITKYYDYYGPKWTGIFTDFSTNKIRSCSWGGLYNVPNERPLIYWWK